jgi:hypothetical protein
MGTVCLFLSLFLSFSRVTWIQFCALTLPVPAQSVVSVSLQFGDKFMSSKTGADFYYLCVNKTNYLVGSN